MQPWRLSERFGLCKINLEIIHWTFSWGLAFWQCKHCVFLFGYKRQFLWYSKQQESVVINCSTFMTLFKVRSLMLQVLAWDHDFKRWAGEKRIIFKNANLIRMPTTLDTHSDIALSNHGKEISCILSVVLSLLCCVSPSIRVSGVLKHCAFYIQWSQDLIKEQSQQIKHRAERSFCVLSCVI